MPFRLFNALAIFQKTMNHVLRDIKDKFVLVYLDDVIIYLLKDVQEVFDRIREVNLRLKAEKCHFRNLRTAISGSCGWKGPNPTIQHPRILEN